ncbi:MAG: MoaD/ThiS family protein [Candidatus Lokiarchaeota archaeon]|nr:MoaD/ThiS family protein [Candidatus Lokiarchaeota archaeon]
MPLKVTALLFGEACDLAGTRSIELHLPDGTRTVHGLLQALHEAAGARLHGKVLASSEAGGLVLAPGYTFMVNKRILAPREAEDIVLEDGGEVGILPPFSGG